MQNNDVLLALAKQLKADVEQSLRSQGRYATGKTAAAIQVVPTPGGIQLLGPAYLNTLELGRRPTPKGAGRGQSSLFSHINQWLAAKGLNLNPFAVTNSIHKKGYKGKPGVISQPLSPENIDARLQSCMATLAGTFSNEVMAALNA